MSGRVQIEDDDFVDAFLHCRIASTGFDHRAHLRIAWLLLNRLPLGDAIEATCKGIERIARHFGVPDKYNRTMSEALVRLIARARADDPGAGFEEFLARNVALSRDVRGVLAQYYSSDRLTSAEAKRCFMAPDLRALP